MTRTVLRPLCFALSALAVAGGALIASPAHAARNGGPASQLTQRLTFSPTDVTSRPAAPGMTPGQVVLNLRGGLHATAPGTPAIPDKPVTFVIPAKMSVREVRAVVEGETSLGIYNVSPTLEVTPDGPRAMPVPDSWQQGAIAELGSVGYERGWKLAGLVVRPVRYDRATGEVRLITSLKLELILGPNTDGEPVARLRESADQAQQTTAHIRNLVVNPDAVRDSWRGGGMARVEAGGSEFAPTFRPTTDGSAVDYVIVTQDSLTNTLQQFADFRTQTGMQAVVRTTSWIQANYPGGADMAETIRRFITDAYSHWGTTYVLLAGDTSQLPYRSGRTTYYGGENIPTDLYFQCLDGNWDADGDSLYGEGFVDSLVNPGDYCDLYPEVYIGRAPLNTNAEAQTWVNKTIAYAQAMPANMATKVLFASEVLFPSDWPNTPSISLDGASLTEDASQFLPSYMTVTRMYQNYTAWPGSLNELKAAVVDSVNSGYMFWEHMGHGYRNTLSCGDNVMTNTDADGLTNAGRQGIVYSVNCNSASFEFNCIAERFLLNAHGGGVAYVGASRYDFPTTVWGYQTTFFDYTFQDTIPGYTLGAADDESKVFYVPYSTTDNSHRWTQMAVTLLGDPALDIYTRAPRGFSVALTPITVGVNNVVATVTSGGQPIAGVQVTLWKANEAYARGTTDGNGQVTLPFNPATTGTVKVGAHSRSDLTYTGTASVGVLLPAYVSAGAITIQDGNGNGSSGNSDGITNPGETVAMSVTMTNTGSSFATGVTASFSTNDPLVTVLDSTATYGTIAPNGSATGDVFKLAIASTASDQHVIAGTLTVRGNGGLVWQNPAVVGIAAPSIAIVGRAIKDTIVGDGDGIAENGETVAYQLKLQNIGTGRASGLQVHIVANDLTTIISDSLQSFTVNLDPGQVSAGNDFMVFQVITSSTNHKFQAWVTDQYGNELMRHEINQTSPAIPKNVTPVGGAQDITFLWTRNTEGDLQGYNIYRGTVSGGPYTKVNTYVNIRTAYYKDEGLPSFTRYYYRIAAIDSSGNESAQSTEISATTNPPIHTGFPVEMGRSTPASPVFGYIDNNTAAGIDMMVGADKIYALRADGTEPRDGDNEPRTLGIFAPVGSYFAASLALDDLDHDGHLEVIATSYNSAPSPQDSTTIWVLDGVTGLTEPGWPKEYPKFGWSTPACGDIDGDGFDEIIQGSSDGWVYAWHKDGTDVRDGDPASTVSGRFLYLNSPYVYSSPALADLNHDGKLDIIIGGNDGKLYALKYDGTAIPGFPYATGGGISSSPAVAWMSTYNQYWIFFGSTDNTFRAVDETGANRWTRYFRQFGNSRTPSPAIGDLNNDGNLEVVTGRNDGYIACMQATTGNDFWNHTVSYGSGTSAVSECSPILSDIDGDGKADVLMGAEDGKLYGFTWDGYAAPGFPIALSGEVRGSPGVWDIDGDGLSEIAYAGWDQLLYIWDLPSVNNASTSPWPMFHHDVKHTGVYGNPFVTGVEPPVAESVDLSRAALMQNAPNPFRAQTAIAFVVPRGGDAHGQHVTMRLFDADGRLVRTLADKQYAPGLRSVTWDGRAGNGAAVANGVYFYRLDIGGTALTKRMVVMR